MTRRISLRRRLALVCAAAVALVVMLGSVVSYGLVRGSMRGEIDSSLVEAASNLGRQASFQVGFEGAVPGPLDSPAVQAQFVPPEGPVVMKLPPGITAAPAQPELPAGGEVRAVAEGRRPAFFADRTVRGVHARVYTAMASSGGGAVQVARSLTEVDDVLSHLRMGLGLLAAIGILLAALLGRFAARTAVRPVTELTAAAEHVAATQDLSRRIASQGRDELARLADAFNTMLARLDVSRSAQRQLVADASHELRTPLTSLRTNLEVLAEARALGAGDGERLRADLVAQLEDLTLLVGDLVDLAREDEPAGAEAEDVRLDLLVAGAVERARRHTPAVRFDADLAPAVVRAVPARLDRAVANLLDNAAKFGGAAGPVEVRVRDGEVAVRDHGPGIAEGDIAHVFDRFYRAPDARGQPGSGLGLAIVRQVAELHGGAVSAEAAPGGGALLRLRLSSTS